MAEGTRRTVDERLNTQENRLDEFQDSLTRMEEMMADMKSLLVDSGKGVDPVSSQGVNTSGYGIGIEAISGNQFGSTSMSSPSIQSIGFGSGLQHIRPSPIHNFSPIPNYSKAIPNFSQPIPNFSQRGTSFVLPQRSQQIPTHVNVGDTSCYIPQYNHAPYANQFIPMFQHPYIPSATALPYMPHGNHKNPKVHFPKFDGEDPKGWLYRCEEYFDFNPMEELRKVKFAAIHMEGRALKWFRAYRADKGPILWGMFRTEVCKRFSPVEHDDPQDDFNKQKQTGTVDEYFDRFEELRSLIVEKQKFSEEYFISGFLSGLKEDIKGVVKLLKPTTLADAIYLARQEESRERRAGGNYKTVFSGEASNPTVVKSYVPKPSALPVASNNVGSVVTKAKLSATEVNDRRKKGLCFYCDEMFNPGHRCKTKLYMLLGENDGSEDSYSEDIEVQEEEEDQGVQISLNALAGSVSHHTIRLKGFVNKRSINILIDSGSTHNFLDEEAAAHLNCVLENGPPMVVTIADGNKLTSVAKCSNFKWTMQGYNFAADMRVIPLGGCDAVLGVEWLEKFSPITMDFQKMQLTLTKGKQKVVLNGTSKEDSSIKLLTGKSMAKLLRRTTKGLKGYLLYMDGNGTVVDNQGIPDSIASLLESYKDVFEEPRGLPPNFQTSISRLQSLRTRIV